MSTPVCPGQRSDPTNGTAAEGRLFGDRLMIIAPHLDDAVLSAWSLINSANADLVLTVFTGAPRPAVVTDWDRMCGFADSTEALESRRAEDDAAFEGLPVTRRSLDRVESHYEGRSTPTAHDAEAVCAAIREWLSDDGDDVIAVPAGAGSPLSLVDRVRLRIPSRRLGLRGGTAPHTDHVWLTDLVLRTFPTARVALYEDIPYSWVRPADDNVRYLAKVHHRQVTLPLTVPVDVGEKAVRVGAYRSQVGVILGRTRGTLADVLDDRERIWILDRPLSRSPIDAPRRDGTGTRG